MITMKTKYALKALCHLALAPQDKPVLIAEIAKQQRIPKKFLELILSELKQHGFLQSRKGRGGGYLLGKGADAITLAAVLRVLDGPIAPVPCLSRTSYQKCAGCHDEATCSVRLVLKDVYAASIQVLESTTLADMVDRQAAATRSGAPILKYSI